MVQSLEQFIERRLLELDELEFKLREQLKEIHLERVKIHKIENFKVKNKHGTESEIIPNTIKDEVMKILEKNKDGLIALDILAELNKKRSEPLVRTSLSPQLSRLKRAGYIQLIGSLWRLVEK